MPTPPPPIRRTSTVTYQERLVHQAGAPIKRAVRTGPPPLSPPACRRAAVLLVVGSALTVAGLFPTYIHGGGSMSAHAARWLFEVIPLVAWLAGAGLLVRARPREVQAGTALAVGSLVITTGLNLSSLLQLAVPSGGAHSTHAQVAGPGFWLIVAGDAVAVIGAVSAVLALGRAKLLSGVGLRRRALFAVALPISGALVVGYLSGWRHYRLTARTLKHAESLTTSSPFHAEWEVIVTEVVVAAGLGLTPLIASQWGQLRSAAAALWGVALGIGGLVALNVIEVATATPETFVSRSEAVSLQVRLQASMTAGFWLEAAGVAGLVLVATTLLIVGRDRSDASGTDQGQPA